MRRWWMIAWVALACSVQAAPQGEDSEAAVLGASSAETAPAVWMQRLQTMGSETGAVASQLLDTALSLVGVPYRKGGNSPQVGFDCSGFVRYVYGQALGLALPRRAVEQAQSATPISRDELRPGDLVFFNTMRRAFSHVGVYLGDGKFVHAPRKGDHVKVSDMNERYWAQRYNGARRIEWSDAQALRMLPQAAGAWLTAPPSRER